MAIQPITEAEWQARDDANTLARAEAIKADQKRLEAAQGQAKKMLEESKKETAAMAKIARNGGSSRIRRSASNNDASNVHNVFKRI